MLDVFKLTSIDDFLAINIHIYIHFRQEMDDKDVIMAIRIVHVYCPLECLCFHEIQRCTLYDVSIASPPKQAYKIYRRDTKM